MLASVPRLASSRHGVRLLNLISNVFAASGRVKERSFSASVKAEQDLISLLRKDGFFSGHVLPPFPVTGFWNLFYQFHFYNHYRICVHFLWVSKTSMKHLLYLSVLTDEVTVPQITCKKKKKENLCSILYIFFSSEKIKRIEDQSEINMEICANWASLYLSIILISKGKVEWAIVLTT